MAETIAGFQMIAYRLTKYGISLIEICLQSIKLFQLHLYLCVCVLFLSIIILSKRSSV